MGIGPYRELRSADAAKELTMAAGNFHDAFVKELHLLTTRHVDSLITPEGKRLHAVIPGSIDLLGFNSYNLRLLVICLWPEPRALEFACVNIQEFVVEDVEDIGGGVLTYERPDGWEYPRISLVLGQTAIVCLRLLCRWLEDMPEAAPILGGWIPTRAEEAVELGDQWVQCPLCGEGWASEQATYVSCPQCKEVFPREA